MPRLTGIEVAQRIGRGSKVVLLAHQSDPALASLAALGALHWVKPFDLAASTELIDRLKGHAIDSVESREEPSQATTATAPARSRAPARPTPPLRRQSPLETIPGALGRDRHEVTVDAIVYLEAEGRFTRVVQTAGTMQARYALKELIPRLDPEEFWQIHRFIVVNRHHVDRAIELEGGGVVLTLKGRPERLPVGTHFLERFRSGAFVPG
jgi:DNA-binding LytR/AlgR family response regulator